MRRYGEPAKPGIKYTKRPGAYVILPRDGLLLMTHQEEPEPEIQFPGGGIDPGESVVSGLYRECAEETGWSIANPQRLGVYKRYTYMVEYDMWAEKICHVYVARPARRLGPPSEDGHTTLWLSPWDALDVLVSPGDVAMLERFLSLNPGRF